MRYQSYVWTDTQYMHLDGLMAILQVRILSIAVEGNLR